MGVGGRGETGDPVITVYFIRTVIGAGQQLVGSNSHYVIALRGGSSKVTSRGSHIDLGRKGE